MIIINKLTINKIPKDSHILGIHPDLGFKIVTQNTKYGPSVILITSDKPIYAQIKRPMTLKNITLDDAIKLLEYPKCLGNYNDKPVMICKGKFGLYIKYDKSNYTIGSECDIDLDYAIELINKKNDSYLWTGTDKTTKYIIAESKYGKYVRTIDGKNKQKIIGLPKDFDIETATINIIKDCIKDNIKKKKEYKTINYKKN
jgi:DNA topoisomerase-1